MKFISKKLFVSTLLSLILIVSALPVFAQIEGLENFGKAADYVADTSATPKDPAEIVGGLISTVLSVLGIIAVVLIIYAGFIWMTAAGNTEKIDKAKKILGNAVIGLIIILMAYSITYFVTRSLLNATR
jgi:heme/copper-type cytochrome/quinol oxidase subunit 2